MTDVELYLDYACPWSYLALVRLSETAIRTGSRIVFQPVVLDWILKRSDPLLVGNRGEKNPARAKYRTKDLNDWASYCGVVLKRPEGWPDSSVLAARGALAAAQQDGCAAYSLALFRAYFQAGSSITETTTLADAACEAQLDSERFADALGNPTLDEQLHANCDELLERGGFGTPTMFLADDMYFGHDRMPLVEFAIGQSSDRRFVVPGDHRA